MPQKKYTYSLQYTKFRKTDPLKDYATSFFGKKVFEDEEPHMNYIGKNIDMCRKLLGIGQVFAKLGYDIGLNDYDNHIWLPQANESDNNKRIYVCMNCKSIMNDGKFVPVTALDD
jgi:hypothetical protein